MIQHWWRCIFACHNCNVYIVFIHLFTYCCWLFCHHMNMLLALLFHAWYISDPSFLQLPQKQRWPNTLLWLIKNFDIQLLNVNKRQTFAVKCTWGWGYDCGFKCSLSVYQQKFTDSNQLSMFFFWWAAD